MSVQVPLGKGISKFPKFKFAEPEFEKKTIDEKIASDIEFVQQLILDGRLIIQKETNTSSGVLVSQTPDTGTTYWFLGAVIQNTDAAAEGSFSIINNGTTRELVTLQVNEIYEFRIPLDRLVGNMSRVFSINGITANINSEVTMYGWNENTVKIA